MENLLERIMVNPDIFGGKPIIRGHRLAVEHVLGMLAAGDTPEAILDAYPGLEGMTGLGTIGTSRHGRRAPVHDARPELQESHSRLPPRGHCALCGIRGAGD